MILIISMFVILMCIVVVYTKKSEEFNIPVGTSTAYGWNTGPGYGAGYGTGYAMWGVWPSTLPDQPWQNWMWGRRPDVFISHSTPMPQIDYNNPEPLDNITVGLLPSIEGASISIDGQPNKTLQLDRDRDYYFHVYAPGADIVLANVSGIVTADLVTGVNHVRFEESDPDVLYYIDRKGLSSGGKIYLNYIRKDRAEDISAFY